MKKITITVLFCLLLSPIFAVTYSPVEHYMLGYVNKSLAVNVTINQNAIPFDLEGSDVAKNENPNSLIRGLLIGTYTLIANNSTFKVVIAHDELTLTDTPQGDGETSVDYRLYAVVNTNTGTFASCVSLTTAEASTPNDANLESLKSLNKIILIQNVDAPNDGNGMYRMVNYGLYVSLEATQEEIAALEAGSYSSNVFVHYKTV